tara:strand:- start:2028 stop:2987 length:960 start_codon:yes stop_codon:yes gene_type:complete
MVGDASTKLRYSDKLQDNTLTTILLDNFINFYDWGLLDAGQFYNIQIPQSGLYGGDRHKLRVSDTPNYTAGQVWEGYRQNWVWESGIDGTTQQPITISGVYVDNTFYATGNVTKPFYIDYLNGRVVFDSAQTTTSTVHLEYSHKWVQVVPSEGVPWFQQIQQGSFRNEKDFQVSGSGSWAKLGQTRVQLPAIAVEIIPAVSTQPYQLGGGQWINSDVLFYVITENHWECTGLVDTIIKQNDRTIQLFNPTKVAISGASPFNYRNELRGHAIPSGLYPLLTSGYPYKKCFINSSRGGNVTQLSPELYIGTARCSTQVQPV